MAVIYPRLRSTTIDIQNLKGWFIEYGRYESWFRFSHFTLRTTNTQYFNLNAQQSQQIILNIKWNEWEWMRKCQTSSFFLSPTFFTLTGYTVHDRLPLKRKDFEKIVCIGVIYSNQILWRMEIRNDGVKLLFLSLVSDKI